MSLLNLSWNIILVLLSRGLTFAKSYSCTYSLVRTKTSITYETTSLLQRLLLQLIKLCKQQKTNSYRSVFTLRLSSSDPAQVQRHRNTFRQMQNYRHRTAGSSAGIPACPDSPFGMLLSTVEHGSSGKTTEGQGDETSQAEKESKCTVVWGTGGHSLCERALRVIRIFTKFGVSVASKPSWTSAPKGQSSI